MTTQAMRCSEGHEWRPDDPLEPLAEVPCPICGAPGRTPETGDLEPDNEQEYEGYGPH